jgi:hypothetical protein
MALTLLAATSVTTPAVADFYFRLPNGRYLYLPDELILFAGVVLLAVAIGILTADDSSKHTGAGFLDEISTPESVEYYEDQAARTRALKRKLDEETELAESVINAKRARAELDEIEEILNHDKAKRRH